MPGIEDILRGLLFNPQAASQPEGFAFGSGEPPMREAAPSPPPQRTRNLSDEDLVSITREGAPDAAFNAIRDRGVRPQTADLPPIMRLPPRDVPPNAMAYVPVGQSRGEDDAAVPPPPVPMPRGRPALGGGEGGVDMPAPPMARPMPLRSPGPPTEQPGGGWMGALGITPDRGSNIVRSLAGGLGSIKSNSGAGSFARGMGGAMAGGNKWDDEKHKRGEKKRDQDIRVRGQNLMAGSPGERNAIALEALDIKREKNESDADFNNRRLQALDAYQTGRLDVARDKNARGNWIDQNWTEPGEHGNTVSGVLSRNRVTGESKFIPGARIEGKPGAGGSRLGQTERLVERLQQENPGMTTAEAIAITKRAPNGDALAVRREGIALSAAKADPMFQSDPVATLDKYRRAHGLPALTAPPEVAKNKDKKGWLDWLGLGGGEKPAQQPQTAPVQVPSPQTIPTAPAAPRAGNYDPKASIEAARAAIARNPAAREKILQKLRDHGIEPGDL